MIYFIQSDGPIKIGYTSKRVESRLSSIQIGIYHTLVILGTMSGNQKKEKEIHRHFEQFHIRGEWFKNSDELLAFIKTNASPYKPKRVDKPKRVERRVIRRIEKRFEDNETLVLSTLMDVSGAKIQALNKRLQRDSTAQYYRSINASNGWDFIIQSEKIYGNVVENSDELDYDFALAAKVSKAQNKRQTGLLYSVKSKRLPSPSATPGGDK